MPVVPVGVSSFSSLRGNQRPSPRSIVTGTVCGAKPKSDTELSWT
jgi:hypothetical protein